MWLSFVLYCAPAAARDPNLPIGQLFHSSWTAKDGLTGAVQTLAQTPDGFLWLGTTDGLLRFDGVSFERYKPEVGSLPSTIVKTLLATPNGDLWIGYFNGGVGVLKKGAHVYYIEGGGLSERAERENARRDRVEARRAGVGGI